MTRRSPNICARTGHRHCRCPDDAMPTPPIGDRDEPRAPVALLVQSARAWSGEFHALFRGFHWPVWNIRKSPPQSEITVNRVAEKPGFEPGRRLSHPTPLAGEPLRPLGYFSTEPVMIVMAEREGFEPPVPFDITGFQDQRLQPLGHLSVTSDIYYKRIRPECQVFTELFNDELTYESGTIRLRSRPPRCRT